MGTEVSPYLISSARELTNIREFATYDSYYDEYYINGYFKQTASFSLSGTWTPIPYSFKGVYNGNYKYIYSLEMTISSSTNYYGIFKSLTGATISNMIISDVTVNSGSRSGNVYIGAICGYASTSTITNCRVYGTNTIAENYNNYKAYIGSFIGFVQHSSLSSCYNSSATSIYGYGYIGGIVGSSYSSDFSSCENRANLFLYWDGNNSNYAGGITAYASNSSTFTSCKNYGTIKFAGEASDEKTLTPYIGQIVGYIDSTTTYSSCGCYGDSDPGNLTKVGGFLGIGRTDQAMYVSDEECGYEA